jgi:hypothetical protein
MVNTGRLPCSGDRETTITTTAGLFENLVPETSDQARDPLDNAFGQTRMCPQGAPAN